MSVRAGELHLVTETSASCPPPPTPPTQQSVCLLLLTLSSATPPGAHGEGHRALSSQASWAHGKLPTFHRLESRHSLPGIPSWDLCPAYLHTCSSRPAFPGHTAGTCIGRGAGGGWKRTYSSFEVRVTQHKSNRLKGAVQRRLVQCCVGTTSGVTKGNPVSIRQRCLLPSPAPVTATLRPDAMETSILDVSHKWTFTDLDVSEVPPRCSSHWYLITF